MQNKTSLKSSDQRFNRHINVFYVLMLRHVLHKVGLYFTMAVA